MPTNNAIRSARKATGKSLDDVARAVGVSERSVRRWELGQTMPDAGSLLKLARVLRRNPEDLLKVA